jgi:hypothetical protein
MKLALVFLAGCLFGLFMRAIASLLLRPRRDREELREFFRSIERAERR